MSSYKLPVFFQNIHGLIDKTGISDTGGKNSV